MSPIRPEQRALYPSNWKHISFRIRCDRARWRCECLGECGLHAGARCEAVHGRTLGVSGKPVVLTVAHLDHRPEHCADENLRAFCERCHNRYDAAHRAETRAARRARA